MRISLLVSTYERPDALAAALRSALAQSRMPDEIMVGDDGSGPETAAVVEKAKSEGVPIRHIWREHNGFRAGRSRNMCAAAATGEYLIFTDDDIYLHPDFVADHASAAEPGFFVQGTRVLLDAAQSALAMEREQYWPSLFAPGIGNRKNLVRLPWLARALMRGNDKLSGIRTCNFAVWRDDVVRVNGFNEDFVGWGREDSEFAVRLFNSGVRRKNLRFAALGCHLHHPPRSRDGLEDNDARLAATVEQSSVRCEHGLNMHMDSDSIRLEK